MTDRPGREVPKEYREIINDLISQGWRYDKRAGFGGHPQLYPADRTKRPIAVAGTPGDQRSLRNFRSQVRQAGGHC